MISEQSEASPSTVLVVRETDSTPNGTHRGTTVHQIPTKPVRHYTRRMKKSPGIQDKAALHETRRNALRQILEERFYGNKAALGRAIGKAGTTVWRLLQTGDNEKGMGEKTARDIEQALNLPAYTLDGQAQSLQSTGSIPHDVAEALVDSRAVPLYAFAALARVGLPATQEVQRVGIIFGNQNLGREVVGLIVDTDAMTPEFAVGDRIIVDPSVQPRAGDSVVALVDEMLLFRRYRPVGDGASGGAFELYASNPNHASVFSKQAAIEVQGVMVEHHRYRRS